MSSYDKILRVDAIDKYVHEDFDSEIDARFSENIIDFKKRVKKLCSTIFENRSKGIYDSKNSIENRLIPNALKGFNYLENDCGILPFRVNDLTDQHWDSVCLDEDAFIIGNNPIVGKLEFDRDISSQTTSLTSKNPIGILIDWWNSCEFGFRNAESLSKRIPNPICDRSDAVFFPFSYSIPKKGKEWLNENESLVKNIQYGKDGISMTGNVDAGIWRRDDSRTNIDIVRYASKYIEVTTHIDENMLFNHYIDTILAHTPRENFNYESLTDFVISIFEAIYKFVLEVEANEINLVLDSGNITSEGKWYHVTRSWMTTYNVMKKAILNSRLNSIKKLYINVGSFGVFEFIRTNLRYYMKKQMVLNEETFYQNNDERNRRQVPDYTKADVGKRYATGCMVYEGLFSHLFDDIMVSILRRKQLVKFSFKKKENLFQISTATAIIYSIIHASFATCGTKEGGEGLSAYSGKSEYRGSIPSYDASTGVYFATEKFHNSVIHTLGKVLKGFYDVMIGSYMIKYVNDILRRNKNGVDLTGSDKKYLRDMMEKAFDLIKTETLDELSRYTMTHTPGYSPEDCSSSRLDHAEKQAISDALDMGANVRRYTFMRISNISTVSLFCRSILDLVSDWSEKRKMEEKISSANQFTGASAGFDGHSTGRSFERDRGQESMNLIGDLLLHDNFNMLDEFEKGYDVDTDYAEYAENLLKDFKYATECLDFDAVNEASKKLAVTMKKSDFVTVREVKEKLNKIFNEYVSNSICFDKYERENSPKMINRHGIKKFKFMNYVDIV